MCIISQTASSLRRPTREKFNTTVAHCKNFFDLGYKLPDLDIDSFPRNRVLPIAWSGDQLAGNIGVITRQKLAADQGIESELRTELEALPS